MAKVRVAVLRGGPSSEYEVSLKTGEGVLSVLHPDRYQPLDVVISRAGEWLERGRVRDPHDILHSVDVVFNGLHGTYGEDGQVQKVMERAGVPFTGSRSYPAGIAMHKAITKDHIRDSGVLLARHVVVSKKELPELHTVVRNIFNHFGPLHIAKPVTGGSSVDTHKTHSIGSLEMTLRELLEKYDQILVEEFIQGREATCGVVEGFRGESLYALPVIEIIPPPESKLFDYDAKYSGKSQEICPSNFSKSVRKEIERAAKYIHEHLHLSDYSRSDFIVTPKGIYFLEVNTLPGLTPTSLMPKAIEAVGATYNEFIEHLINQALERR